MSTMSIGSVLFVVVMVSHVGTAVAGATATYVKCCEDELVLSDDLSECVHGVDGLSRSGYAKILEEIGLFYNDTLENPLNCFEDENGTLSGENCTSNAFTSSISCLDFQKNGSLVHLNCSGIIKTPATTRCDNVFTFIQIYGASMMIFANIVYLISYTTVCMLFAIIPGMCRRAYDKVVLSYIVTQAVLSIIVITLGHYLLCHKPLSKVEYSFFGIALMITTISSVLWLLVISIDVSSTITRFRWVPSSGAKNRNENHKFRVYLLWVTMGTMIPSTLSIILQFSPIPDDNIIKPNFHLLTTLNYRVIVYVATVPVLVAIMSNILFIYTTVVMIKVQKSTSAANENRKKNVKKKYFLYLKLYLLMDAPYVTGALGSIFEDLWVLKFFRMVQPILMVYAVLPRNMITSPCKKKVNDVKDQTRPKIADNTVEPC